MYVEISHGAATECVENVLLCAMPAVLFILSFVFHEYRMM